MQFVGKQAIYGLLYATLGVKMATSISNLNVENWKVWQQPASTQKLVVNLLKDYQVKELVTNGVVREAIERLAFK